MSSLKAVRVFQELPFDYKRCKCGSGTHFSTQSHSCPLNKTYKALLTVQSLLESSILQKKIKILFTNDQISYNTDSEYLELSNLLMKNLFWVDTTVKFLLEAYDPTEISDNTTLIPPDLVCNHNQTSLLVKGWNLRHNARHAGIDLQCLDLDTRWTAHKYKYSMHYLTPTILTKHTTNKILSNTDLDITRRRSYLTKYYNSLKTPVGSVWTRARHGNRVYSWEADPYTRTILWKQLCASCREEQLIPNDVVIQASDLIDALNTSYLNNSIILNKLEKKYKVCDIAYTDEMSISDNLKFNNYNNNLITYLAKMQDVINKL